MHKYLLCFSNVWVQKIKRTYFLNVHVWRSLSQQFKPLTSIRNRHNNYKEMQNNYKDMQNNYEKTENNYKEMQNNYEKM